MTVRCRMPSTTSRNVPDLGLETLLDFDGFCHGFERAKSYVNMDVKRVRASPGRPQGIKYSLTLHSQDGTRLIGFGNAHPVVSTQRRAIARPFDHWHPYGKSEAHAYQFRTAFLLLADFFNEVNRILAEIDNDQNS